MKSTYLSAILLLLAVSIWTACKKESQNFKTPSWPQEVSVKALPVDATKRNFESELNLITDARTWTKDNVTINFDLNWTGEDNPVQKVDLYLYVQEKTASGPKVLGGTDGKAFKSISAIDVDGKFSISTTVDEIYNLFKSDFTITNRPYKLTADDIFEIKWVLTGKDGKIYDGRQECLGENCQYSFTTTTVADLWSGSFSYVYVQVGSGVQCCTSVPKVVVGTTGTLVLSKNADGSYTIPDVEFGASYNGKAISEKMTFNSTIGTTALTDANAHAAKWTFTNNKGNTVDLKWTNKWESYGEWGVIRLTRTDGIKWPSNLK